MTRQATSASTIRNLGTFDGVFVPTLLTICGVILYTRTTWLVGTLGFLTALTVILAAYIVAICTAFSICSFATNNRVGAGGAFSLLTQTLGIEAGGSIGTTLYLSQSLAAVLYIIGFREGWVRVFPEHSAWVIDYTVVVVVAGIALVSAKFAFRTQYLILFLIICSMLSIVVAFFRGEPLHPISWTSGHGEIDFFKGFGVFFPAVTGILAGVNLSGELKTPKKSIRTGLLWALGVSALFYVIAALAGTVLMSPKESLETTALIQNGYWSQVVLAGLLGATFSSALNCVVGAPRILQALAEHRVVPKSRVLAKLSSKGEPRRCLVVTLIIISLGLLLRDLNAVAPLITLFFLLTYGSLNAALWIQQGLNMPHFRPTFRVPLLFPAVGTLGCAVAMWLVDPIFSVVSCIVIIALYSWLEDRSPKGPFGQVKAGLLLGLLHRAFCRLENIPNRNAWHVHALALVEQESSRFGLQWFGQALAKRGGSICFFTAHDDLYEEALEQTVQDLRKNGVLARRGHCALLKNTDTMIQLLEAMEKTLVPPNLVLYPLNRMQRALPNELQALSMGLWFYRFYEGERESGRPWEEILVWLHADEDEGHGLSLVLLSVWRLHRLFGSRVRWCLVGVDANVARSRFLERTKERARIPESSTHLYQTSLEKALRDHAPTNSLNFLWISRSYELQIDDLVPDADIVTPAWSGEAEAE